MIHPCPNYLIKLCGAGLAGLLAAQVFAAGAQDIVSPASVERLRLETESTNVVLTWPSDPRETFAVLWRSNTHWQTPWVVLTNQLRASSSAAQTTFHDLDALRRLLTTNTNLADSYRVFAIPDFWFDMSGVQFEGGPEHCGEDLLPLYNGIKETEAMFKPEITLLVDGGGFSTQAVIERINFGTREKPRWAYSRGLWFPHQALPNGWHTLQLSAVLRLNNFVGDWGCEATMTNKPVRVCISNEVSFVGFPEVIEGSLVFVAQSANPRVNWRLEYYDARGVLLLTKTGQTTNGDIRWSQDLRDTPQQVRDSLDKDLYLVPRITTWPLDKSPKGGSHHAKRPAEGARDSWWDQTLGHGFVRKIPSPEEFKEHLIHGGDNPLEKQVPPRPLGFLPLPDTNRRLPR